MFAWNRLVSGATHYYSAIKPARVKQEAQKTGQNEGYTEQQPEGMGRSGKRRGMDHSRTILPSYDFAPKSAAYGIKAAAVRLYVYAR